MSSKTNVTNMSIYVIYHMDIVVTSGRRHSFVYLSLNKTAAIRREKEEEET